MRLKPIVVLLVATLIIEGLLVVGFSLSANWWRASNDVSAAKNSPITDLSETEKALREKLDNYSKRVDDLGKLLSLLLTLTTIYTIVLGVSAYASVQNNLRESEKGIARLDGLVREQEEIIRSNRDVIPKQLEDVQHRTQEQIEEMQRQTLYTRRIAVATAISQFPQEPENYKGVQETFVKLLMEMRSTPSYATDHPLNQLIAHLYVALERYRDAEQVMTTFIGRKRSKGERDDDAITDAYYDRACYRALQWPTANEEEKANLVTGITRDLTRAFRLNNALREFVKTDLQLKGVASESWFQALLG
jgi:hypothetical protein